MKMGNDQCWVVLFVIVSFLLPCYINGATVSDQTQQSPPFANTTCGRVQGLWRTHGSLTLAAFLGIRYGSKPIRFHPPSPAQCWNGTLRADGQPKACIQWRSVTEPLQGQSEDCLFLNVFAPRSMFTSIAHLFINMHHQHTLHLNAKYLQTFSRYTRQQLTRLIHIHLGLNYPPWTHTHTRTHIHTHTHTHIHTHKTLSPINPSLHPLFCYRCNRVARVCVALWRRQLFWQYHVIWRYRSLYR